MITISPFSPLFFTPSTDRYGVESRHIQLFATEDKIVVQVLADDGESVSGVLKNIISGAVTEIKFSKLEMSSSVMVYTATISQLPTGYYSIAVNDIESDIFHVTDDRSKLEGTSLIKYTSSTNRLRSDVVFVNGSEQYEFMFRVPGGFKDNDWAFQVNNEQFETSEGNIVELFAVESTAKTFTMGDSYGCPIWFGEHLNRILCCTHVHINGVRYVRKGNSTPEVTQELPGQKSYIFKVQLQGMVENVNIELPSSSEDDSESEGGGIGYVYLIKVGDDTRATDSNTYSALRIAYEIEKAIKENNTTLNDRFIRKDMDDRTPFKLYIGDKATMEKGLQIGKNFAPGILTGFGGYFDEYANGEIESLIIRRFLEVPELRFNRVQVTLGDKWNAPGAGIVEKVVTDYNADGSIASTGTIFLKLEEGEYGAVAVGDICMGIFHSEVPSENAAEDYDDSRGNFMFAGFYTAYFTITEITGKNNGQFKYQMRPVSDRWKLTYHPRQAMHFVCYGSFTNTSRQTSVYTTRTYTRLLKNQNTWEISASNIAMQYGNMENMSLHGLDMTGYSVYLNNIYMTGVFKQVKPDGTPVQTVNDRGAWVSGTEYAFYDRVSHNGSLWLCVNESGTNSEPSKTNSDWLLQVASGDSLTAGGRFSSANTPYSPNSIVDFAEKAWITTDTVSDAPYPIWTDHNGNRLMFSDSGFCLVDDTTINAGWQVLLDTGTLKDGEDGKSLIVQWSTDGVNWHDEFTTGDIYMRQKVGEDAVWSGAIRIAGEKGAAGENGEYTEYEFAVNGSVDTAPTSGWADTPPTVGKGQYLWMRMRVVQGDGTAGNWSIPVRIGGEKGDSVEFVGRFYTGLKVPYLGIVQMGDANWAAKKATTNPPLWCWTDESGNRLQFSDGGFIITGEENKEYELMVANGKDGSDGNEYEYIFINTTTDKQPSIPTTKQVDDYVPNGWHDDPAGVSSDVPYEWVAQRRKKNGIWGEFSAPSLWAKYGEDGTNWEFIYQRGIENSRPSTPETKQQDDYIPTGWTDDPAGVSESVPYEWMCKRAKKNGIWGEFSTPSLWAKYGEKGQKGDKGDAGNEGKQGIQGCVIRDSEWALGTEYRNDEALTSGTRYIDVALVRDDSTTTGWVAYKCLVTHTSTASNAPGNTTYWEEFSVNVSAIFTSLIVAKNAKIKFLQGNQLLIQKEDGTVTAGLSGSIAGQKVRFWAGSETPDDAPFRVTEDGDSNVSGTITAGMMKYKTKTGGGSLDGYTFAKGPGTYTMPSPTAFMKLYAFYGWGVSATLSMKLQGNGATFVRKDSNYVQGVRFDNEFTATSRILYELICIPDGDRFYWIVTEKEML